MGQNISRDGNRVICTKCKKTLLEFQPIEGRHWKDGHHTEYKIVSASIAYRIYDSTGGDNWQMEFLCDGCYNRTDGN